MELISESLLRCTQIRVLARTRIHGEYRRTRKAEKMIFPELLGYRGVHITELAPVTFIEDDNNALIVYIMRRILANECRKLLNSSYDNAAVRVFKLLFQYSSRGIAVRRALLKAVILAHGLIVEVFTVNDKQHLVNVVKVGSKPCRLERGKGLAGTRCMPDITAACDSTELLVVVGNLDTVQNTLSSYDLIRAHDKQQAFRCEYAVFRDYVEDSMLCKERLCEVHKIGYDLIVRISPERRKLKAVACFGLLAALSCLFYGIEAGCIGIILRVRAVGDHENLHILKKTRTRPEAVTLIAVYLIERFTDRHSTPFQFDMHKRKAVDKHRHIIAVLPLSGIDFILIDDLQAVVMDILLVDQRDIF